jgi:hypothetical protein
LFGDAAHDVLQPFERFQAVRATDFFGVAGDDLVGVFSRFRCRDRNDQQDTRSALGRLGERLREGELVVEGAAGQVVAADEGAGICDPFVDQNDGGGILREEIVQGLARGGAVCVGLRNQCVAFGAAELPGQLAPDGVDVCAVVLGRSRRAEVVADDGDAADLGAGVAVLGE